MKEERFEPGSESIHVDKGQECLSEKVRNTRGLAPGLYETPEIEGYRECRVKRVDCGAFMAWPRQAKMSLLRNTTLKGVRG